MSLVWYAGHPLGQHHQEGILLILLSSLPPLWCQLLGHPVLAWRGFPLCHRSPGRGKRERCCRHPVPPTDNGHPEPAVTRGDGGVAYQGVVVSLAPYITTPDPSTVARLRHRDELWGDYETRHYAEVLSGVLSGVASLDSHHKAQWWAFMALWAIVGEKQKAILWGFL